MANRIPIGWTALAGAVFLGYLALMAWCGLRGPSDPGIVPSFDGRSMRVVEVRPDTPAARAGVRPGDIVLAPGAVPIRTRFDWMALAANWDTTLPVAVEVRRAEGRDRIEIDVPSRSWTGVGAASLSGAFVLWGARLFALAAAIAILTRGRLRAIALLGAWFLASASVASVVLLPGMAKTWRELPVIAGVVLFIPALCTAMLPAIFFAVYARYPNVRLSGWRWLAALAPAAVLVVWIASWLAKVVYAPERAVSLLPPWFPQAFSVVASLYILAGIAIQAVDAFRLSDIRDRVRARVLAGGAVVGWAAALPIIVFDWRSSVPNVVPAFYDSRTALLAVALFLASVVLLGMILLRKRVFGFRFVLRAGLRYALARRFLISIVPACAVLLVADLLLHGDQPVMAVLQARGWFYLVLAALGAFAASRRESWLRALDRRFFREHYEAQQILRDIAEIVRTPGPIGQIAAKVVARIESSLHSEVVALMTREAGQPQFACAASAPAGQAPPPLSAESRLVSLVRLFGKSVEFSPSSSWLLEKLPEQDLDYAKANRIEVILPIASENAQIEALLLAGPKRSEEQYSRQDQDLLSSVAASLGLLLSGRATRPDRAITNWCRECPVCGACYDSNSSACEREGAPLAATAIPRILADRYRLDRRVGSGGMGTVYEGLDTALERRVAVKIIHDKLVGSLDAAARFRREARAAASFSHPNIVTVFDFGIVAGTRAYLVMELLLGSSLRDAMRHCEGFPMPDTAEILRGMCDGIQVAHQRRLIHRDLKPENIFLDRHNSVVTPKILDFGLIKSVGADMTETLADTQPGVLMGTFHYIAPEQLLGEPVNIAADLWGLAMIAYEMLTGTKPYDAPKGEEWRRAVLGGHCIPPSRFWPAAPPAVDEFFRNALSPDPARRPSGAAAFYTRLKEALDSSAPRMFATRA